MPLGVFAQTTGACPVCGSDVARMHAFNGLRLLERYDCYRCRPTAYTSMASA